MKHEDIAVIKRNSGYNCAQAVLCAYAEELRMDEKQLFALSEGFGSGLGCTLGTCGALRCRDIKGIETGNVLCECEDCVRIACRLVDEMVFDKKGE